MIDTRKALKYLSADSPVSRQISSYERREGQEEMTSLICEALNSGKFSVIEAGTGIGKSFAYLIPAIEWVLSRQEEHLVISTGTINLQYQLYEKDLPFLCSHIDPTVTTALLMGRGNYLCLRRLYQEVDKQPLLRELSDDPLSRILHWSQDSTEGVRTELGDPPSPDAWAKVRSDSDFCLGFRCPERGECFVNRARSRASEAQIIVVNHHVLYADALLKMDGDSFDEDGLLPAYSRVICDEAHKIEDGARDFFSEAVSRGRIVGIINSLWNERPGEESGVLQNLKKHSADPQAWNNISRICANIFTSLDELEKSSEEILKDNPSILMSTRHPGKFVFLLKAMKGLSLNLNELLRLLERIKNSIDETENDHIENQRSLLAGYSRKLTVSADVCSRFNTFEHNQESIFWIEKHRYTSFNITPHSAAAILQTALLRKLDVFIAVSATLTVDNSFSYWKKSLGLQDRAMIEGIIPSPFDYKNHVILAVPTDAPPVENREAYLEFLNRSLYSHITLCEGRTLVLFTSFQLLSDVYEYLNKPLKKHGITSLAQLPGSDRSRLLASFKENDKKVLFATESFWEGVDVPGDALTQLVITRLPFQVPVEPVFLARKERISREGGNPFMELAVPIAAMKLKQGFGRLIRKSDDRGVVIIFDNRLVTKQYGKYLLGSLPETFRVFTDQEGILRQVENFLFP